jgi:hypothetical protein
VIDRLPALLPSGAGRLHLRHPSGASTVFRLGWRPCFLVRFAVARPRWRRFLARVPNNDTVSESLARQLARLRDQEVLKRKAPRTLRETTQAMPTECFLVVRTVRFGNPNDPVFGPAVETVKGSLSLFHDARTNRESRHGIHPAASKLIDQPEARQFPPSHSTIFAALDTRR